MSLALHRSNLATKREFVAWMAPAFALVDKLGQLQKPEKSNWQCFRFRAVVKVNLRCDTSWWKVQNGIITNKKKFVEVCNRQAVAYVDSHKRITVYVYIRYRRVGYFPLWTSENPCKEGKFKRVSTSVLITKRVAIWLPDCSLAHMRQCL